MCLNETYSRVCFGKLLILFIIKNGGVKQGDAFAPLLFNFDRLHAIWRFLVNQDGLKVNGTQQLLVFAEDVYILGGSVHTIRCAQVKVGLRLERCYSQR
jgi:hypothetical protein